MVNYQSSYTGSEIDAAIGLLNNKNLNNVVGLVKRNANGDFIAATGSDVEEIAFSNTYIEDSTPYSLRQTGGDNSDIGNSCCVSQIVGGTVCWN